MIDDSMKMYKLVNKRPVLASKEDIILGRGMSDAERRVGLTHVGRFTVSTVFLMLDHSFGGDSPIFYETMVFDRTSEGVEEWCERHSTYEEAEQRHAEVVHKLKMQVIEELKESIVEYSPNAKLKCQFSLMSLSGSGGRNALRNTDEKVGRVVP